MESLAGVGSYFFRFYYLVWAGTICKSQNWKSSVSTSIQKWLLASVAFFCWLNISDLEDWGLFRRYSTSTKKDFGHFRPWAFLRAFTKDDYWLLYWLGTQQFWCCSASWEWLLNLWKNQSVNEGDFGYPLPPKWLHARVEFMCTL